MIIKQKRIRNDIYYGIKISFSYISYYEQFREFDSFLSPQEYSNPWTSDNTELWEMKYVDALNLHKPFNSFFNYSFDNNFSKEISLKRVKQWGFSLRELLKDPAGREQVCCLNENLFLDLKIKV